ncbi:MFS transporter [uncultured Cellulomonas sp.]|uniref:MFS transporter n=1 Tax=uncultured Cellulomonas sp. TaxID=189682 RepID=UPI0028E770B4|nr:MFS transporter [uncultured Cellulomonas sp.]
MLRPLAHRTYRRLFAAQVVALAGTGLATVALGLLAYDLAGDDAGSVLGTALAIKMLAYVVVAPVAAVVVARLPRRAVLVGADVVRLLVASMLPFVGEVWHVFVLIFVLQAASATFTPTFQSVIPQVLPDEDDYTAALSLSRLAYDLEAVLAPVLAAALLLLVPSDALFVGTAAGFAGSALLVGSVVLPRGVPVVQERFTVEVRRGAALFVRTPALRPVLALNLVVAAAGAYVLVQTVVIVRGELGLGDGVVALVLAANGLGSIAAALTLPRLLRRVAERRVMLGGAVLLAGTTAVIPFALHSLAAVSVLWVLVGLGWAAVETPVGRLVRREVPTEDLPAAFAAQFSLSHACWLVTYPLAGWLGTVGLEVAALALAVVAAAATLTATLLWPSPAHVPSLRS